MGGIAIDLDRDPANGQTLFVSMLRTVVGNQFQPGGIFKSTDGGETWMNTHPSPYSNIYDAQLAVAPSNPSRLCLFTGGYTGQTSDYRLETSSDGGKTWAFNNLSGVIDVEQFGYNTVLAVDPVNSNVIYAGTRDIQRSSDAGKTWENLTRNFDVQGRYDPNRFQATSHPDQHALAFDLRNPSRILIGNDGGLSISDDGGKTFKSFNQTLGLTMFVSLAAHPTNPTLLFGGTQDNGTQRRQTMSGQWEEFAAGDGGNCVVDPVDPTKVYTTYIRTTVYRFGNEGERVERIIGNNTVFGEPNNNARVAFYPPFTGNGVDSRLYFGTWRLFVSTDQGNTWTAPAGTLDLTKGVSQTTGTDVLRTIGVSRSSPNVIYTGSAQGRVMTTSDGGKNWRDVTAGLPLRTIKSLVVHPTKPETVYLTVSGYGTGHVFRTNDSGGTWTDISGNLPNIPTNTLLIDPMNDNTIYVGTDIGVFRSFTDGNTWETFNHGLPPAIVTALIARKDGGLLAATYGRGAFELKSQNGYTVSPSISVLTPQGGENSKAGGTIQITWKSSADRQLASHDITLSTDGGASYPISVAVGLPGSAQSFAYVIPKFLRQTKTARIRVTVTDEGGNSASDASDGNFKIK